MSPPTPILFFGSGAFGLPTLQALAASPSFRVAGVITQPDRPAGRGGKLTATPIGDWAARELPAVPLIKPEDVNEPSVLATVRQLPAREWVVIAFGQKLSPALLAHRFAINLHASLLPRWRGAAPINRAVMAGDAVTGNSVITLADKMDAGLVLGTTQRTIQPHETAGELHDLLSADGPSLVLNVLALHRAGTLQGSPQNPALVTKAAKLSRDDAWVDFSQPAEACRARINGLSPWPGVDATFRGEALKILRATRHDAPCSGDPGTIHDPTKGVVCCGDSRGLTILDVQPPGKKAMPWSAFAAGRQARRGEIITGRASHGGPA